MRRLTARSLLQISATTSLALACSSEQKPAASSPDHLASISALAGVELPPSARLVFEDTSDARADSGPRGRWIIAIAGSRPPTLPGEQVNVSASTVRENIHADVPDLAIGKSTGTEATVNDWSRESSRWSGAIFRTDSAVYLILDRSKR